MTANHESLDVTVTNISASGMQIQHAAPVKLNIATRISVPLAAQTAELRGEVLWSHLLQDPDAEGKFFYRSGVKLEDTQANALAVERLLQIFHARADGESLKRKREILRRKRQLLASRGAVTPTTEADQTLLIRQVCERLKQNPEELQLLARRARTGVQSRELPSDEILAVWEYLQRSVTLEVIRKVLR